VERGGERAAYLRGRVEEMIVHFYLEELAPVVHVEHGVRERESASARTWTARR
jgi:hypothetical protein